MFKISKVYNGTRLTKIIRNYSNLCLPSSATLNSSNSTTLATGFSCCDYDFCNGAQFYTSKGSTIIYHDIILLIIVCHSILFIKLIII